MSDTQRRLHDLRALTGQRWPGSDLVATRGQDGDHGRRMYVELEGVVVADSGWCEGTEGALDALEHALTQLAKAPAAERPRKRRSA